MKDLKITVIIACKNEKETIERTLLSIINQTYKNFEIIIMDGASTDGTLDIIEKYGNYISHCASKKDGGIYYAMNQGISFAYGDFLYFLNAGDTLYSDKIFEILIKNIEKYPKTEMFWGDVCINYPDGKTVNNSFSDFNNVYSFFETFICHQSTFYKRSLFEKFGNYDTKLKIAADIDFNMKLLVENNIETVYIPTVISNFYRNGASSDIKNQDLMQKENNEVFKRYYPFYYHFKKVDRFFKYYLPSIYKSKMSKKMLNRIVSDIVD
jgi:glycosyltransferase involved in cell wall biosynthesis